MSKLVMVGMLSEKLKSRKGVSILFSLLALLLAVMVSAVLVNAALTNTKRVSRTMEQNQDYLTAESAAKLVKGMLSDFKVTFSCEERITTVRKVGEEGTGSKAVSWTKSTESESDVEVTDLSGNEITSPNLVISTVKAKVVSSLTGSSGESVSPLTISVDSSQGKPQKNAKVTITPSFAFSFDSETGPQKNECKYDIAVNVGLVDASGKATEYSNAMKIASVGKLTETGSTVQESEFEPCGTLDEAGKPVTEKQVAVITHNYEITWSNFLITKGSEITEP